MDTKWDYDIHGEIIGSLCAQDITLCKCEITGKCPYEVGGIAPCEEDDDCQEITEHGFIVEFTESNGEYLHIIRGKLNPKYDYETGELK